MAAYRDMRDRLKARIRASGFVGELRKIGAD